MQRHAHYIMNIKVIGSSSKGNGYIISSETGNLIIECGMPLKEMEKYLNYDIGNIVGVLITHEHGDHAKYAKQYLSMFQVYATHGTLKAIGQENHYNANIVTCGERYNLGAYQFLPFRTEHDAAEPCGYLVKLPNNEILLFATDTSSLDYVFPHVNYWMVECNYSFDLLKHNVDTGIVPLSLAKRIQKSHLSLRKAKYLFESNDMSETKGIILLHLSDRNSNGDLFKQEIMALTGRVTHVAIKGLKIELL